MGAYSIWNIACSTFVTPFDFLYGDGLGDFEGKAVCFATVNTPIVAGKNL